MTETAPPLRFDRFTFHPASGELRAAGGEVVRLEPQPAKVLALLAGRAGELVSREELQREVWPDGTFVDFERGLNYCVAKIRAALGDSAAEPRFVETLPRRGYRFVAAVEAGEEKTPGDSKGGEGDNGNEGGGQEGENERPGGTPVAGATMPPSVILALGVALATAFGVIAWFARDRAPALPTVAVARFDDETARGALDREAQTLTDSIVEALARPAGPFAVIGNASILRTPRSFRDLPAIAEALDADLIVLGQLQQSDGETRVLVHLIRADDQKHVWAQRYVLDGSGWRGVEVKIGRALRAAVEENVR